MPLVSIFLPTFSRNASGLLHDAIASVLCQSMPDFELFVVDDGSTDGSVDTISNFSAKDSRVRHIRFDKNIGLPALTCAEAFRQSTGEFIAWQFDDCTWEQSLLRDLMDHAAKNSQAGLIYGQAKLATHGESLILGEEFSKEKLLQRNFIPNCATLTRRSVFSKTGWLDPSVILKKICDYDLWVRISEHFDIAFLEKVVATENGLTLPDSLGNSVSLNLLLSDKYRKQDRSANLQIERMSSWDPYRVEPWMDRVDREDFAQIAFEHLFRIKDYSLAARKVFEAIPENFIFKNAGDAFSVDERLAGEVFDWYLHKLTASHAKRESEAIETIFRQRDYIDEQHAYIERQHLMIRELEANVLQLQSQLVARRSGLTRLINSSLLSRLTKQVSKRGA